MTAKKTIITLKVPVQHGETEITVLELRRPKGKDLRSMKGTDLTPGDALDFAGKLAAQPDSVMDELDIDDVGSVMEAMGAFFANFQKTGSDS